MSAIVDTVSLSGLSGAADRRRRIIAIVGASSGNLVEWYDFYAYAFTSIYFASAFPERWRDGPAPRNCRNLRGRLFHAAVRWLAVRLDRRYPWPKDVDGHLGADDVRRIAHDFADADLCNDRRGRADRSTDCPACARFVGWRRVRHGGYLHERGRLERKSRFLLFLPVRDAHRRATACTPGPCALAGIVDRGRAQSLGLAYPLRDRCACGGGGDVSAAFAGGNSLRGSDAQQGSRLYRRARAAPSARGLDRAGLHHGWLAVFLYFHHLHAEISGEHRAHGCPSRHLRDDGRADPLHASSAVVRRALGSHRPQEQHDLVYGARHACGPAAPVRAWPRVRSVLR